MTATDHAQSAPRAADGGAARSPGRSRSNARRPAARSLVITVALLCALACASSCRGLTHSGGAPAGATGTIPAGRSTWQLTVGGHVRAYLLYRPAALPASVPLVVMLHGGFGNAAEAERYYGWDQQADAGHFLVAYPDGLDRAWNAGGGCCGRPAAQGVNDVSFVTALVHDIGTRIRLDPHRIYATGMSNGAIMAYRLACASTIFAAIAPVAGTVLGACPDPAPISVLAIHGTADQHVRFDGGKGDGYAHIDGPAVPTVLAAWRRTDHCGSASVARGAGLTTTFARCPGGREVELIAVTGAGHQWPGAPDRPVLQKILGTDAPSRALDATATIWRFFAAHAKS